MAGLAPVHGDLIERHLALYRQLVGPIGNGTAPFVHEARDHLRILPHHVAPHGRTLFGRHRRGNEIQRPA